MLSDRELEIVQDCNWILTKQKIIAKMCTLFNEQVKVIQQQIETVGWQMPAALLAAVPKISRGENYLGMPWLTLDYPAVFSKEDVFALRTMFWWGNFVSVTIHLSGTYKLLLRELVTLDFDRQEPEIFICVNTNEWQHHFKPGNYTSLRDCDDKTVQQILTTGSFIKFAVKIDLKECNNLRSHLLVAYKKIIQLVKEVS